MLSAVNILSKEGWNDWGLKKSILFYNVRPFFPNRESKLSGNRWEFLVKVSAKYSRIVKDSSKWNQQGSFCERDQA